MVHISLAGITRRFGAERALDTVSLDLPAGSFTSLLGPSGCGKTTMLRLIAGFDKPDEGTIKFDGQTVADRDRHVPPERRGVGVVFQSYALWPHMDVDSNIAYPLATRGVSGAESARRVAEVLETVGLAGFGKRRVEELSGGQRQRVALARCVVAEARIILFDEPLANLDMHLRATMVDAFRDIHRRLGATMVYVTHDQSEALALSDRIAVMKDGRILQCAAPTEIYRAPIDESVAGFVGRGARLDATWHSGGEGTADVEIGGHRFFARCSASVSGPKVRVLLRPEALSLAATGIPARVVSTIYRGPVFEVSLEIPGQRELVVVDCAEPPVPGANVQIAVSDAWIIPR
ncbi:ABC transporter [Rhizobium albus]|nr:ABC transporter [Rhizobium albus]